MKSALIVAACLLLSGCAVFFCKKGHRNEPEELGPSFGKIVPVRIAKGARLQSVTFGNNNAMNMEDCYSYTLVACGDSARLTIESLMYDDGEKYETMVTAEEWNKVCEVVRTCDVGRWNGFSGSDPRVLDGGGFDFSADFSDGSHVSAHGSNCYPEGYGQLYRCFCEQFDHYRNKYRYARVPKVLRSDVLRTAYVHFKQQGGSGSSWFDFELGSGSEQSGYTVKARWLDLAGEFGAKMSATSDGGNIYRSDVKERVDLSALQKLVRKYDLPSINGYDVTAEDYANSEWFQISLFYADDESVFVLGTEPFAGYDEFRKEFIRACLDVASKYDN